METKEEKFRKAQATLLSLLWKILGGNSKVARILKIHRQNPVNWKLRGRVPLAKLGFVSRTLNIPPEVLNFEGVVKLYGKSNMSWDDCVRFVLAKYPKYNQLCESLSKIQVPPSWKVP